MDKNKLLAVFALVFIAVCGISYILSSTMTNEINIYSPDTFSAFFINNYDFFSVSINIAPPSSGSHTISYTTGLFVGFPFYFLTIYGRSTTLETVTIHPIPLIIDLTIWFAIVFSVMLVLHNYNLKHALTNKIKTDLNQLHSHNRYAMIGLALIIYAMFLTPAYFEPTDFAISTGWIAFVFSMFPNMIWIIPIWMWTGYVAVLLGAYFIGKRLLFEFGVFGEELYMHPKTAFILVSVLAAVLVAIMHSTILG